MTEERQGADDFNPYAPPASVGPGGGTAPLAEGSVPVTTVTYRLTPEDALEAQRGIRKTEVKIGKWFLVPLVVVSFAVVFYFSGQKQRPAPAPQPASQPIQWGAIFQLFSLLFFVVFVLYQRFGNRGKGKESPHEITMTIDPAGVRMLEGDFHDARTTWGRCSEIRETPSMILIFTQAFDPSRGKDVTAGAVPIPKRAFDSPEAAASFLEAARRWHAGAIAAEPETR